jgi:penicillin-binding protein 1A
MTLTPTLSLLGRTLADVLQTLAGRGGGGNPAGRPRRLAGLRGRRRHRFPVLRWTLLAALVGVASFVGGMLVAPIDLTVPARLPAALLLDANEKYFASIRAPELREDVPASAIPDTVKHAVIAAEDERYFQHQGVDPLAIMRAGYRDVFGSSRQGGSTITQQYVKNIYVGHERTVLRKMREAALAYRAEQKFGKDEILLRYLNSVYLGNGTYGVQAASKYYFGVPVKDLALDKATHQRSATLELARAAMLAGIIAAPSAYNPVRNLHRAKERQFYTLERMSKNDYVTPIEASRAYRIPLALARLRPAAEPTEAPVFTDMVTRELKETLKDDDLYRGGLRIKTTLDLLMQRATDQAVYQLLPGLNPATPNPDEPDAAVVAIDPRNGDLKAIFSSRYTRDGFNIATQARRSTGSAIKPFTLAAALENGRTLDTTYYAPGCITIVVRPLYRPCNSEPSERGTYTLRRALAASVNTVYVKLAADVGRAKVKAVAEAAGLGPPSGIGTNPAMALGVEVTPLSLARGYATLAAGGVRHDVRMIVEEKRDADTKRTFSGIEVSKAPASPKGRRVVPKAVADQVVEAMYDVVEHGTATAARQPGFRVFGKTGTTDNFTNAWFAGCRPDLCVVTWLGYRSGLKEMRNVHGVRKVFGGTIPAMIFSAFWQRYAALKAADAAGENASPAPSATPSRRPFTRTPSPLPTPARTSAPPVTKSPAPTRTASPEPSVTPSTASATPSESASATASPPGPVAPP